MSADARPAGREGAGDDDAVVAAGGRAHRTLRAEAESRLFVSGEIDPLVISDFHGRSDLFAARTHERAHAAEHVSGPLLWLSMLLSPAALSRRMNGRLEAANQAALSINIVAPDSAVQAEIGGAHEVLHLFLRPSLIAEVAGELSGRDLTGAAIRPLFGQDDAGLSALLQAIGRTIAEPAELAWLKVDYLARALSADLLAKYADGPIMLRPEQLARGGLSQRQLSRVRDYVEAHLADEIHVDDLAAIAGVGRTAFTMRFRASTGMTPYQHVMAARVERAKRLLAGAGLPLAEIAILCGFADQAHFATTFKRRTGLRPLDYRAL